MEHTKLTKEFTEGYKHFLDCIDFGGSHLDAEAIRFMNELPGRLVNSHDELVEALLACQIKLFMLIGNQNEQYKKAKQALANAKEQK